MERQRHAYHDEKNQIAYRDYTDEEQAEYEARMAENAIAAALELRASVNAERARRIVKGTVIDGIYVTGRDEDARNLQGLAFAAQLRLGQGDESTITVFRDGNNIDHKLTPMQVIGLWQAAAGYVTAVYAASWAIKAMDPIPADYASDKYWNVALR